MLDERHNGLGLLKATTNRFRNNNNSRIPHNSNMSSILKMATGMMTTTMAMGRIMAIRI